MQRQTDNLAVLPIEFELCVNIKERKYVMSVGRKPQRLLAGGLNHQLPINSEDAQYELRRDGEVSVVVAVPEDLF